MPSSSPKTSSSSEPATDATVWAVMPVWPTVTACSPSSASKAGSCLRYHGKVGASQNLDIVDILGNHHRLVERGTTEQVGKDEHAIALLAHGGNSGAEILTVGSSLVALERNDGKSGLVTSDHSDSACKAGCELSMTGKNKANHSNFPSEGVYDLSPMMFGSQRAIALKASWKAFFENQWSLNW